MRVKYEKGRGKTLILIPVELGDVEWKGGQSTEIDNARIALPGDTVLVKTSETDWERVWPVSGTRQQAYERAAEQLGPDFRLGL